MVFFLSAGADSIRSSIFKKYLTRMIQEGYLKSLECILGDLKIFPKQLLWSLRPGCGAGRDDAIGWMDADGGLQIMQGVQGIL